MPQNVSDMKTIDSSIRTINDAICNNIELVSTENRGFISQNILSQLRNFIDHISLKVYSKGKDAEVTYENIKKANTFVCSQGNLRFLSRFHKFLQISASHYTLEPENSERLMLKYYEYLLKIKSFMKNEFDFDVLENLDKFPINLDTGMNEYYDKIASEITKPSAKRSWSNYNDRYYIQKTHPFFVNGNIYYEVTFNTAIDNTSKFDRHIAFTGHEILPNYAVKLNVSYCEIEVMGKTMPIQIIDSWEVSIRPCEFKNFSKLFGEERNFSSSNEVLELMEIMTYENIDLLDIIDLPDAEFERILYLIGTNVKKTIFSQILKKCRNLSHMNNAGCNIIRYILYSLNNKIIKSQISVEQNQYLSGLYLKSGCKPFDDIPFNSSLIGHNPKLSDIFKCIDPKRREEELLARLIRNNTEIKSELYTPEESVKFENIHTLIQKYNNKLYYKHRPRREINTYKNQLYINEYEDDCHSILQKLKSYSGEGVGRYTDSVDTWLRTTAYIIDCPEKTEIVRNLFSSSRVALIYGAAGTGKSTLINHISSFFKDKRKAYLANTNPAVDNLKRKVNSSNTKFMTINKFINSTNLSDKACDILFIDECSTVSNADMNNVLNIADTKLIVLVGDVFQIESILFGNWFFIAKHALPESSVFELTKPYRSNRKELLTLWNKVRNIENDLLEHIATNGYSEALNESIFDQEDKDEIILCLNYDGIYGINNINRFLQNANLNPAIQWGIEKYKVGDPILFNESNRFYPIIYNNLKGRITNIISSEESITFDIEIFDIGINDLDATEYGFELVNTTDSGNTTIRFAVNKLKSTDEDDDSYDTVVPFQIAYAISIHKAQGLEYNSVKIVITNETEEMITHNILYTAITRAKEKLKIYWTPETEKKIIGNLKKKINNKDWGILKSKYSDLRQ